VRVLPAQPATDQPHGQLSRVEHHLDASSRGKPAQQAHLPQVYRIKTMSLCHIHRSSPIQRQLGVARVVGAHVLAHKADKTTLQQLPSAIE